MIKVLLTTSFRHENCVLVLNLKEYQEICNILLRMFYTLPIILLSLILVQINQGKYCHDEYDF